MDLNSVITWCNENTGFISMLLSVATIMVSVIAIIVSIRTARLPYRKKVIISAGTFFDTTGKTGFHITATNIGNRSVFVKKIGFKIGKVIHVNFHTLGECQKMLSPGEDVSQYFSINDLKQSVSKINKNPFSRIYAVVEDSEGKMYRKKFISVGKLNNL